MNRGRPHKLRVVADTDGDCAVEGSRDSASLATTASCVRRIQSRAETLIRCQTYGITGDRFLVQILGESCHLPVKAALVDYLRRDHCRTRDGPLLFSNVRVGQDG